MRTHAIVFPFELFGNGGTGAGAQLLGDVLREMIDDGEKESRATRSSAYRDKLRVKEFGFETLEEVAEWRSTGRAAVKRSLAAKDFLLWLGGNHLSAMPVYEELGADTLVIQFDAHLDIYNLHDCTPELSHGNFLLHAEKPLPRVINIGSRDLFLSAKHVARTYEKVYPAAAVATNLAGIIAECLQRAETAKQIWIDIDVDAIDPAFCPAVHQPLPFGLMPMQLLAVLEAIWSEKVIGVSIVEYDPGRDVGDTSLNLLGWLLEWLLLKQHE